MKPQGLGTRPTGTSINCGVPAAKARSSAGRNSSGERARIYLDDAVSSIDGKPIANVEDIHAALNGKERQSVALIVKRELRGESGSFEYLAKKLTIGPIVVIDENGEVDRKAQPAHPRK